MNDSIGIQKNARRFLLLAVLLNKLIRIIRGNAIAVYLLVNPWCSKQTFYNIIELCIQRIDITVIGQAEVDVD